MEALEKRVTQLKSGQPPQQTRITPKARAMPSAPGESKRDWDYLGGEMGDLAVVEGFRAWADKTE